MIKAGKINYNNFAMHTYFREFRLFVTCFIYAYEYLVGRRSKLKYYDGSLVEWIPIYFHWISDAKISYIRYAANITLVIHLI